MRSPFKTAEDYINLKRKCQTPTWGDVIMRINDMILMPMITLFFVLMRRSDFGMILSTVMTVYRSWSEWIEYNNLRMDVQSMFLHTMRVGGPFIVTNDPEYMPYVFADAVQRVPVGMANAPP